MTREELLEQLRTIEDRHRYGDGDRVDRETMHLEADALLLKFIADEEITKAFNALEMWYA